MPWDDVFIYGDSMFRLVQGEMARVHFPWFETYKDLYGEAVRKAILAGLAIEEEELDRYRRKQIELRCGLAELMRNEKIDVRISPAQAGIAPKHGQGTGWGGMTQIWSFTGCPEISIPAATINNLPIGFQCTGGCGGDEELLQWAGQIATRLGAETVG